MDGKTAGKIRQGGVDLAESLAANDAYAALKIGGTLLSTGTTGTNVNDLRVVLVWHTSPIGNVRANKTRASNPRGRTRSSRGAEV